MRTAPSLPIRVVRRELASWKRYRRRYYEPVLRPLMLSAAEVMHIESMLSRHNSVAEWLAASSIQSADDANAVIRRDD